MNSAVVSSGSGLSAITAANSSAPPLSARFKKLCAAACQVVYNGASNAATRAQPSIDNFCVRACQAWTGVRTDAQELFKSVCSKRKRDSDSKQQLLRDPRREDKTLARLAENIYDNLTDWGDMTRDQFVSKMLTIATLQDEYPIALDGDCAEAVLIYRDDVVKQIVDKEQRAKQLDELEALIDVEARLVKRRGVESGGRSNDHDMPDVELGGRSNDHDMPDGDGTTEVEAIQEQVEETVADLAHVVAVLVCLQKLEENKQVYEARLGQRFAQRQDASNAAAVDAASDAAAVDAASNAAAVDAASNAASELRLLQQPQQPHCERYISTIDEIMQERDRTYADFVYAVDADAVDAAIADAVEHNLQQPQSAAPHRRTLFV
jgi:hypothetical protein